MPTVVHSQDGVSVLVDVDLLANERRTTVRITTCRGQIASWSPNHSICDSGHLSVIQSTLYREAAGGILVDYFCENIPGFSDTYFAYLGTDIAEPGQQCAAEIFPGVQMIFCWIPAGKATLGSPENEKDRYEDEVEHSYETQGFWLGKYEVTQFQWESVMGNNPSFFQGANLPVEQVSWDDCQGFIKKCSVSGFKVQLPHEDQWEYACRGGKGNKQPFYWGHTLNGDKANCEGSTPYGTDKEGAYLGKTTEVGSYEKLAPHPWNLCDMSGNVWEWCENLYTNKGSSRVLRGGGWRDDSRRCRSSYRNRFDPSYRFSGMGFRLALVP